MRFVRIRCQARTYLCLWKGGSWGRSSAAFSRCSRGGSNVDLDGVDDDIELEEKDIGGVLDSAGEDLACFWRRSWRVCLRER